MTGAAHACGHNLQLGAVILLPMLQPCCYVNGKDMDAFLKSGWRIISVACVFFFGTFVGSAIIAEVIMRMMGPI